MGKAREPKTSPRRLAVAERRRRAIELRIAGLTHQQIVDRYPDLGYKTKAACAQDVTRALEQFVGAPARELVALEHARLERLNAAVWPAATQGDTSAVESARRLSESRRKLHGLDAADRAGHDGSDVDAWLDETAGVAPPEFLPEPDDDEP